MKYKYISLAFLLVYFNVSAQEIGIYGFMPVNPNLDIVRVAKIEPITGAVLSIDTINQVSGYSFGTSVFDSYYQAYSFIGVDPDQNFKFYNWSVDGDSLITQPPVSALINDLEHDMNQLAFYGLGSYAIDPMNGIYALRFLKIDRETGVVTELNKMPEARAFPVGSTTFNANDGLYIANILDDQFNSKLYTIEAETGEIITDIPMTLPAGMDILNLEFNNQDNLIYGFIRNYLAGWYGIGSIDPSTGLLLDTIYEIDNLKYFVQGGSVFHQLSQNYVLYYTDTEDNSRLLSVNVDDRTMTANPLIPGYFSDLQIDNNEYALNAYHNTVDIEQVNDMDFSVDVFPNPSSDKLSIRINDFINEEKISVEFYTISNNLVKNEVLNPISNDILTVDISDLKMGYYVVVFKLKNSVVTKPIIKL